MGLTGKPNFGRKIFEMMVGEEGYVSSGSLFFDRDEIPYLNRKACFNDVKGGGFKIRIKRTGPRPEDYEVDLNGTNYLWFKSEESLSETFKDFELEGIGLIRLNSETLKLEGKLSGIPELRGYLDEAIEREDYASAARLKKLIEDNASEQRSGIIKT